MIENKYFNRLKTWQILLVSLLILVCGLVGYGALKPSRVAAVPLCFDDASYRLAARNATASFPRQGMSRNTSGCGEVPASDQYVLLSSYYHDGTGAPGSTLHTPGASFRVIRSGAPASAVRFNISATGRCDWSSANDVRLLVGGVQRAVLDPQGSFYYDLPAASFVSAPQYGDGMYTFNTTILALATESFGLHCRIRVWTGGVGNFVVTREDATPTAVHAETQQRYNQGNAGVGTGPKEVLGPAASGTNGAFALYSTASGVLEYSIPIKLRCDLTTAQTVRIRYYDPDSPIAGNATGTSQSATGNMQMAIYDESTGTIVPGQDRVLNGPNDGNDTYNEFSFTMQPARVYSVVWYNVQANNGIQIWMPYSEITTRPDIFCASPDDPPTISAATDCANRRLVVTTADVDVSPDNYAIQRRFRTFSAGAWGAWGAWATAGTSTNGTYYHNQPVSMDFTRIEVEYRTVGRAPTGQPTPTTYVTSNAVIYGGNGGASPCYTNVSGTVYNAYNHATRFAGLTVETCVTGLTATTSATGTFTFKALTDAGYCVRIPTLPTGAAARNVRPWAEGYATCAAYSAAVATPDYCAAFSGYEWQMPSRNRTDGSYGTYDRTADTGFDFAIRFPPTISCAILNPPGVIEVGDTFPLQVRITNTGGANRPPVSGTATITVTGQPNYAVAYGPIDTTPNFADTPVRNYTINTATTVTLGASATGVGDGMSISPSPATCTNGGLTYIGNFSYLKSYGSDIWAGGGFDDAATPTRECTVNTSDINTFAEPDAGAYHGSSAQFGVTALMNINTSGAKGGFYSASARPLTAADTRPPKGLTFANTGATTYGGNYGNAYARCMPDYHANFRQNTQAVASLPGFVAGRQQYDLGVGDETIGGLTINNGTQVAVFVDGNVYINGNIVYGPNGTDHTTLPNFTLVVRGNIYIDNDVTQLDGLYIAQPDPGQAASQGRIYTCAQALNLLYLSTTMSANCGNQLAFNGAVIAQQLRLLRTFGTLNSATPTELPNFATGRTGTNAAEVFNYSPEMYLGPSALVNTSSAGRYDAITSLPPIY